MGHEHGAKTMALICLDPLTERYEPVLAGDAVTVTLQPGKITGFRRPNGAGTTATLRMPVELTRATPGTPIIDSHTHLRPAAGRDTPRGRENSSPANSRPVTRLGLAAIAVLIVVVAVAAAYLAAHGWSHTVQQVVHTLRHLPQPLRALVGGSAFTHLLN
jgi:ABC-type branched-subunit amino acid transport system ATPase component